MKKVFWLCTLMLPLTSPAQKLISQNGVVSFFSTTPMENISASNKHVMSLINIETSEIVFSVPVKEFKFDRSLMEEHFNEKYMESDKYPKATFSGTIEGFTDHTQGIQKVFARGKLTIHGVTHNVEIPGTIEHVNGKWILKSKFEVKLEDYKVEIPKLLWQNIAEQIEVLLDLAYLPQQQKI
jgi:polyisoprenoid-binding protein YceI